MAAAAGAEGLLNVTVGEPHDWGSGLLVWSGAVAAGALEGLAVGLLQFAVLTGWLPGLSRRRWLTATLAVTLLGWALMMVPSSLISWHFQTTTDGTAGPAAEPPFWLMPIGGVVAGAALGAIFGAAQCRALRGQVAKPRRWITANGVGWAGALALMMTGASIPDTRWSLGAVLLLGAVTGILAGLVIGAITGLFLPSLDDPAPTAGRWPDRVVTWLLRSPAHRVLSASLLDLRYTGRRTGTEYALPVQYAVDPDGVGRLLVVPGRSATKTWWRNLAQPAPIEVTLTGRVRHGTGRLLTGADPARAAAVRAYRGRWPRVPVTDQDPVVVLELEPLRWATVDQPATG
jgi:MFS family permease